MLFRRSVGRIGTGALLMLVVLAARPAPAAAQITFGSPGDPPRIAMGGGAFDVIPDAKKQENGTVGLLWSEYRFGDQWWILSPLIGVQGTSQGAFYGYFGLALDIHFAEHLVLTPSAAAGWFYRGQGFDLGSPWEFRTGAELDWRFADLRRVGVAFYHMSNAGIGKKNPGEEMATAVFTVPFQ